MIKFGYITEVNADKGTARVKFDGEDGIVSYPLPMSMPGTVDGKFIIPFIVNEHVWCMMDERLEFGVIGGAIYDKKNTPDGGDNDKVRVSFVEGLWIEYSRNSKSLSIGGTGDINIDINGTGKGKVNIKCQDAVIESLTGAEVKATTEIKLTAPLVTCSGILAAAQISASAGAGGDGGLTIGGNMQVDGNVNSDGEITGATVKEGAIQLGTHKHSGVQTGDGTSGTPVP